MPWWINIVWLVVLGWVSMSGIFVLMVLEEENHPPLDSPGPVE